MPLADAVTTYLVETIVWREDVRVWHPGQAWIWQPGGLGVFDPGINALSIVTHILPKPVFLTTATLEFPENRDAPIAASLSFSNADKLKVEAVFDWRQTGKQSWDIVAETAAGQMVLSEGGAKLSIALRSAPAQNATPPAPVTTSTRASSSSTKRS